MAYKLYDFKGQQITFHDLQDKTPWCQLGVSKENFFIDKFGLKINLKINPEKLTNKYAPDLAYKDSGRVADLKTQNTPLFEAYKRYNINPQYAVVFNLKDFTRYTKYYPGIHIYFWVNWLIARFDRIGSRSNGSEYVIETISVIPTDDVWLISLQDLAVLIKDAPIHTYAQRQNDTRGNARDSYVLDLRHKLFTKVI